MKKLLVLLLLIPSLSWTSDLKDFIEGTNTNLLTFGIFKINYQLDSNIDEIIKRSKSKMNIYSINHFKMNFDLDNKMPGEALDVQSAVEKSFRVWDFDELYASIHNEKDRLLIVFSVDYTLSSFDFDDAIKKKKISQSNFFEDFNSVGFLESFDSKTICRILRSSVQSQLGFFPPSGFYDTDSNDFKMTTDIPYTETMQYRTFINEYFTNEGTVWKDIVYEEYKPMQIDINVLAKNTFQQKYILCHGNAGDFNPSIVEYEDYNYDWNTGLYTK